MSEWTTIEDVRSFLPPAKVPPVWVQLTGISYCDHTYRVSRQNSDVTVIEYVIRGNGTINIFGSTYHPTAGDIYILPEGSTHTYKADPNDPWLKIFVNLQGSAVSKMIEAFGMQQNVVYHNCEELHPIFVNLFETAKSDLSTDQIMEQCCMLLSKLLNRMSILCLGGIQPTDEASQLKSFIDRNYHRDLSMKDISGAIFRSNDYANKLFKQCYGVTPYAYYIDVKIANAKALLLHTALSVHQISDSLGYKNDQYFSKQFHKVVGMTASRYRAKSRAEASDLDTETPSE